MILLRYTFAILALGAGTLPGFAVAKPKIVPFQTRMTFSSRSRGHQSLRIKSIDGNTAYILSLEPDLDVGNHVVTVELVLQRPNDKAGASNLLDPTGKLHGLQSYDFAANDLAQGGPKSVFGQKRIVRVDRLHLVIRVVVSGAAVHPIASSNYQIDELTLNVEVDNSNR